MARPISITILVPLELLHTDVLTLEIDGEVQRDRIPAFPRWRGQRGFGYQQLNAGGFGVWALSPDQFPFGAGPFGQGAYPLDHQTVDAFVAGDYEVRVRASDDLPPATSGGDRGNVSAWSDTVELAHRPAPPPPRNLAVSGGVLGWTWQDPE